MLNEDLKSLLLTERKKGPHRKNAMVPDPQSAMDRAGIAMSKPFRNYMKALTGKPEPRYREIMDALIAQGLDEKTASQYAMFATKIFESTQGDLEEATSSKEKLAGDIEDSLGLISHHKFKINQRFDPADDYYELALGMTPAAAYDMAAAYVENHLGEQLGSRVKFYVDGRPGAREVAIVVGEDED